MTKLIPFLKPYRIAAVIALLLMLIELAAELAQPFLISKVIDDGILKQDLSVVMLWGGILVGFSLLAFSAGIINSFYASHVSQSFGFDVREKLYTKVQSFTFEQFNLFPTSSLITRMTNDIIQLQNTLFMGLRIMLRAPLLIIGGVIMALIIDVKLALILALVLPILGILLFWIMKRSGSLFRLVQERVDSVNNVMQENLAGMRLIKAFLRRKHEVRRFTRTSKELQERTESALRTVEFTLPITLLIMNVSILAILWFGSIEINTGGASVGEVVAIINYATRITGALSIVSMIIMTFSRARASGERISDVLQTEDVLLDSSLDSDSDSIGIKAGQVVFERVSFQYPETQTKILRDITFTAKAGGTLAILGATGSGKSSLFQLIPRLYEVDEGTIYIDDRDITTIGFRELRKQIGFVPQEPMLFTGTVKENIAWGKEDASIEEIIEAAQKAQIHDTIMKLPQQYEAMLGQKGVNLSGGQKQRISTARALIRKPKLLLLDDSTSALDVHTEAMLLQAVKELSCTTLMITQKLSTAMSADTILLLEDGVITAQGNHTELMKQSALYQKIYQSQFGEEAVRYVQGNH
jgi:ATP-binding cassette subfamily B multidrug efflux pump